MDKSKPKKQHNIIKPTLQIYHRNITKIKASFAKTNTSFVKIQNSFFLCRFSLQIVECFQCFGWGCSDANPSRGIGINTMIWDSGVFSVYWFEIPSRYNVTAGANKTARLCGKTSPQASFHQKEPELHRAK